MAGNIFHQIANRKPRKNAFDLSHDKKLSLKMGALTPILLQEVVPGDTFKVNTEVMIRFAPMLAPVMHRVNVYTHYFFVPNRIVWDNWEDFITGGRDGKSFPTMPFINFVEARAGRLPDYLGVPELHGTHQVRVNALPFKAYQMIWNEYYRDQNLTEPVDLHTDLDGDQTVPNPNFIADLVKLRNRCWEKDYFTSALPFVQRGGDVHLPMGGEANVILTDGDKLQQQIRGASGELMNGLLQTESGSLMVTDPDQNAWFDPNDTLKADMSTVTSATINDLRRANRLQAWLEKNARGGARYIEQIFSHFGVKSSDARLQRPEYLGGGKCPVTVSEVLQTSQTTSDSVQGNMAGHGIAVGNSHRFKKTFEEHGYIIGIMSVLPRTAYQDGIPKVLQKFDKFDYFWPEFANLGEQPVYNCEVKAEHSVPDGVFGYQSRYAEYKFNSPTVHGDFKNSLSFWHMGRQFSEGSDPTLSEEFVTYDNSVERPFAVKDDSDKLWCQLYHNITAVRPMPIFGTPTL